MSIYSKFKFILILLSGLFSVNLFAQETNGQIKLAEIPDAVINKAKKNSLNLANRNLGTKLDSQNIKEESKENSKISGISEDVAGELKLEEGENHYILELKGKSNLNRFSLKSFGAKGSLQIFSAKNASADRKDWKPLTESKPVIPGKFTSSEFPFEKTKVIILDFVISQAGGVSKLDLAGDDTIEQVSSLMVLSPEELKEANSKAENRIPFNFASLQNGGRITHVSSGDPNEAVKLIDDDVSTPYDFPAIEKAHTIILDLKDSYEVNKFSMLADAANGTLQIFKLNKLPDNIEENEGSAILSEDFLSENKPIFQETYTQKEDKISVTLNEFASRFVLLRWIRFDNDQEMTPPLFASSAPVGLRVYEIGFLGEVPEELPLIAFIPRGDFLSVTQQDPTTTSPPQPPPVPGTETNPDPVGDEEKPPIDVLSP